jgi:hypothetical protein
MFIGQHSNVFRGGGTHVVLLLNTDDESDAKQLLMNYVGEEPPEDVSPEEWWEVLEVGEDFWEVTRFGIDTSQRVQVIAEIESE